MVERSRAEMCLSGKVGGLGEVGGGGGLSIGGDSANYRGTGADDDGFLICLRVRELVMTHH